MAEAIQADTVVALSNREVSALIDLFDAQTDLSPSLQDLNNTLQAL